MIQLHSIYNKFAESGSAQILLSAVHSDLLGCTMMSSVKESDIQAFSNVVSTYKPNEIMMLRP